MFSFDDRKNGVVVQYSIDNGDNWEVLGSYIAIEAESTGVNWYTTEGITSDPGNQDAALNSTNRFGWAGQSSRTEQYSYEVARHKLDEIPGTRTQVRFRFALASGGTPEVTEEGFAFDDFWIGERAKQVVLEKFSSTTSSKSINASASIGAQLADPSVNNGDIIDISYHTEFKENVDAVDPFNQINKSDPGSRVLFYGITEVPTSIISGDISEETYRASANGIPYSFASLAKASLSDPLASISIEQLPSDATDLAFNVAFQRLEALDVAPSGGEHRLYVVVAEDSVLHQDEMYRNVMRKILPNGNGEVISGFSSIPLGETVTYSYNWEIIGKLVNNPDKLKVIAFIQSNDTKRIYQTARLNIVGKAATETGIDIPGELASSYGLYPNPANTEVSVRFDSKLNNDFEWRLIDQAGATISNGMVMKGAESISLDTRAVPSGMYFVIISNENGRFEPRKLLVIH